MQKNLGMWMKTNLLDNETYLSDLIASVAKSISDCEEKARKLKKTRKVVKPEDF